MVGVYLGSIWTLGVISSTFGFVYLPPSSLISSFMLIVFFFLLISNLVEGLGAFFSSRSLDLIVATPISSAKLFLGKSIEVAVSSSWMVVIFVVPAMLGFGSFYSAPWSFFPLALLIILPLLVIAVQTAIFLILLFSMIVPANRTREVFVLVGLAVAAGTLLFVGLLFPEGGQSWFSAANVADIFWLISIPNTIWSPPYWVGVSLGELLQSSGKPLGLYLLLLGSFAVAIMCLTYFFFSLTFFNSFSRAQSQRQGVRLNSRQAHQRWQLLLGDRNRGLRAIAAKEYRVFFRDISQASQSLMLLGICSFYVFGIRIMYAFDVTVPGWEGKSWGQFLVLVSAATEAFIVSAVCTRFVYPSVSLEGESFWILQTSPLSMRELLRAKFLAWLIPVSLLCVTVFSVGAAGIGLSWDSLLLKAGSTFFVCYGMVGLAIGLGAVFANFNWEHSAQLAAGFGNLVFMLAGVVLVSISLLLLWVPFYLSFIGLSQHKPLVWLVSVLASHFLLAALNFTTAHCAMRFGERALLRRGE